MAHSGKHSDSGSGDRNIRGGKVVAPKLVQIAKIVEIYGIRTATRLSRFKWLKSVNDARGGVLSRNPNFFFGCSETRNTEVQAQFQAEVTVRSAGRSTERSSADEMRAAAKNQHRANH
jgi:hypothetical protein